MAATLARFLLGRCWVMYNAFQSFLSEAMDSASQFKTNCRCENKIPIALINSTKSAIHFYEFFSILRVDFWGALW
jgi:hypothetical protein